eukprot:CAMPEP_0173209054 /NCGR_PEP_ID=MMETSP1141-20130122/22874_1 /TAXON_ID=483371 /ORGANISM="non described non described, Strain CCMP2298" /LENGTH=37 /DNA_ID= /DNA_START= /DNA_END= /DNA_ORIENTATION=
MTHDPQPMTPGSPPTSHLSSPTPHELQMCPAGLPPAT